MPTLRSSLIRLAYTRPNLRPHLLPLLKTADKLRTLTPSDLAPGVKIVSKENPEWGIWKVLKKYDEGIWEITSDDRRRHTILMEGETKFWDLA